MNFAPDLDGIELSKGVPVFPFEKALREHVPGIEDLEIWTLGELCRKKAEEANPHTRIVFTNGVFDILHAGHVEYLRWARYELRGSFLVVAINSDASVARLKGPRRPIHPLSDRIAVLSALKFVGAVVPFDDETPTRLIERLRPEVYVKGGDYDGKDVVDADLVRSYGGEVVVGPKYDGRSTTQILETLRDLNDNFRRPRRSVMPCHCRQRV